MRNGYLTKLSCGFLLCLLICLAGCDIQIGSSSWPRVESQRTEQLSASLEAGSTLEIETSRGSITITGADVTDCSITATIKAWADSKERAEQLAQQVKIQPKSSGRKLTIVTVKPPLEHNECIGVDFDLTVPKQTHIECASSRGSIELTNITGNLDGQSSRGSITAENIQGSVRLNTSRGSVTCKNVSNGDVNLQTSRDHITIANTSAGSVVLKSSRGNIDVSETSADKANIISSRGHITCGNVTFADLKAETRRGNFNINYSKSSPPEITASVTTSRGNIDFGMPPSFTGRIDLTVSRGSINTKLPIMVKGKISNEQIKGTIGDGNGGLDLNANRGSITIK